MSKNPTYQELLFANRSLKTEIKRLLKCESNLRKIYEEKLVAVKEANMVFRYFNGKLMLCLNEPKRKIKMETYKVEYYTLCKGKEATATPGNLKQFNDIAYIQCLNTSKVEILLKQYYSKPQLGLFYIPVITNITAVKGHCIIEENKNGS